MTIWRVAYSEPASLPPPPQDVHRAAHIRGSVRGCSDSQVRLSLPLAAPPVRQPLPVLGVQGDGLGSLVSEAGGRQRDVQGTLRLRQSGGLVFEARAVSVLLIGGWVGVSNE